MEKIVRLYLFDFRSYTDFNNSAIFVWGNSYLKFTTPPHIYSYNLLIKSDIKILFSF